LAHPTVFSAKNLMPERMIALANALKPEDIPPMVKLAITEETFSDAAGLAGMSERLFDTPSAIARVWRALDYSQTMTLSAVKTEDPNGRPLQFEWVLLRGNPKKVRIKPLDPNGNTTRIEIDWHDARPVMPLLPRTTNRVDIGVFAWNGAHYSAPAFVSVTFPTHQARAYSQESGMERRLQSIDYSKSLKGGYVDPALHWVADWRDEFGYDDSGRINFWQRVLPDQTIVYQDGHTSGPESSPQYDFGWSLRPRQLFLR